MFCWLTSEDAEDSSGDGDLGLGLFGGRADLDALESEQSHDDGAEAEQQRDDHQSATRLHVTCTEEETDSPQRQWTSERSFSSLQGRLSLCMLIFCRTVGDETDDHVNCDDHWCQQHHWTDGLITLTCTSCLQDSMINRNMSRSANSTKVQCSKHKHSLVFSESENCDA